MKKPSSPSWTEYPLVWIALGLGLWSCGSSGKNSTTAATAGSCAGTNINGTCCTTGSTAQACNSTATPAALSSNAATAAQTAQAGQSAVTAADNLTSGSPGTGAKSSAALAGGLGSVNSARGNSTLPNTAVGSLGSASNLTQPGTAGSGTEGTPQHGSLASVPDPSSDATASGVGGSGLSNGIASLSTSYNPGSGGATSGTTNRFGANVLEGFGGASDLSGKSGVSAQSFSAKESSLDRAPASGSMDPADYFTRLDPNDDLFKVVERRYQNTASHWATEQAGEVTKSVFIPTNLDKGGIPQKN